MKILLALGSDSCAAPIADALRFQGWHVVHERARGMAAHWVSVGEFDAALIPADDDAREETQELRACAPDLSILTIGHAPSLSLKSSLFGAGADDVLSHPVAPQEIGMRAGAIARRRLLPAASLTFGHLTVVPGRHALVRGSIWRAQRQEWELLELLALRAGRVVSRESMMARLYADRVEEPDPKIIDVRICRLRGGLRALGLDPALIVTVPGQGYSLPRPFAPGATPSEIAVAERPALRGRALQVVAERRA